MQDRFKFRLWHIPTKKMLECYGFNEHYTFANTFDGIGTEYNPCITKDCILMQCTGLHDKNGKLIFESDCLGCRHNIVEWGKCGWCVAGDRPLSALNKSNVVIGNIYENAELLEN